jgi:hypothetical protein
VKRYYEADWIGPHARARNLALDGMPKVVNVVLTMNVSYSSLPVISRLRAMLNTHAKDEGGMNDSANWRQALFRTHVNGLR